jgi:CRISPR/Cas system endoribonuclease Cas6 (RAMP superfamily)
MMGLSGELCIQRWRQDLTPLLVLGEAANVGAETAFGLGRFAAF